MKTSRITNYYNAKDVDIDKMISDAVVQKEKLLLKSPNLKALQDSIDAHISEYENLADRFAGMVSAIQSFRNG